jgi:hypothetical protein
MSIDVLTVSDYGVESWMTPTYTVYLHFSAITGPHIIATFSSNKETYEKLQEIVRMAFILAFSPPTLLQEKYFEKGRDYGKYGFIHICHSIGFTVKTTEGYEDNYQCTFFTTYCADILIQASKRPIEYIHFETQEGWLQLSDFEKKDMWATDLKKQVDSIINKAKLCSV